LRIGPGGVVGQADLAGPPSEVVRERGDHGPGAVRRELAGGEVRERLVFEIADRELDDGVLAMLVVRGERVVAPVREQLGLSSDEPSAADDQPPVTEFRLGDLRLSGFG
jgi:hypothetical protein